MNKPTAFALLIIGLLSVSVGFNVYQYSQNASITNENRDVNSKLEMSTLLTNVQLEVNAELAKLDISLRSACAELSTTNLQDSKARNILSRIAANTSLIVNAATSDANDIILAVEPSQYRDIEGEDIQSQEQNLRMHQTMQPAMSDMILLVEGFYGVVMVAPIFNENETFVGSLSLVIQPYDLLKSAIEPAVEGTQYSMWTMQTNGTLLYDPDPVQQGKNLFTDPIYVAYPTVQAFVHQAADSQSGYGTYQYHQDTVAGEIVNKEAYWTTAGIYGTQWRIIVLHVLDS